MGSPKQKIHAGDSDGQTSRQMNQIRNLATPSPSQAEFPMSNIPRSQQTTSPSPFNNPSFLNTDPNPSNSRRNSSQSMHVSQSRNGSRRNSNATIRYPIADVLAQHEGSPRHSITSARFPVGDFRNSTTEEIATIRADVMVNWLFTKQKEMMWTRGSLDEGIVLKRTKHTYVSCPPELSEIQAGLFDAVAKLNVKVAMTVNTNIIKIFLRRQDASSIVLEDGLHLQILPEVSYLPQCQKHHFAAFIQDTALLVVWDDNPTKIIARAERIQKILIQLASQSLYENKEENISKAVIVTEKAVDSFEEEAAAPEQPRRPAMIHAIISALTLTLLFAAIGNGWRSIVQELKIDQQYIRLAFAVVVPLQMWLGLFFMQTCVSCIAQIFGPIGQAQKNSKYFSALAPSRLRQEFRALPHVTIQCPVYKEGLHSTIIPTVQSLKAAISTYEMQGGSANIFVNDDGMQLISESEAQLRRDFYEENNIGWVARPRHDPTGAEGIAFVRGGRFKKASNMNYALAVSNRVEERLSRTPRHESWSGDDEIDAYYNCLEKVIEEDQGLTWAEGNIRVGDYILLVDSDTRVPNDCFLDAVTEMELNPEVAILQYPSGVLNVTNSYFENGIAFFTTLVYTAISYIVACGDVAPFVGHNALLRWSALQEVAMAPGSNSLGNSKASSKLPPNMPNSTADLFWSESTVSEDFELALRLQASNYTIRLATYAGLEFKEGVSLTVYDELARWKKYAYGCSELLFNPFRYWVTRGPFTPLFRRFMGSSMPLPSKIGIMGYMGTYFAIASSWVLITANFFLIGWYFQNLDHYYIDSFRILFSIIIIFSGVSNLALALLRYRTGEMGLFRALWENFKWVILLWMFFAGVSMHLSAAILSHLFSINISWTATAKELEDTTFFIELWKLIRRFKFVFGFCVIMAGGMIYMSLFAPYFWRIDMFTAIFPLSTVIFSHFLLPIVLNPSLMLFTW